MEKVIFTVTAGKATVSSGRRDDDFADRLNSRYSPLVLIVFTIIISIGQLVRSPPITCWAPVHFTDSHTSYANSYCWIRNTYYLPFDEVDIPHEGEWRQILRYYQYIQFVLLGQAACFYLPTFVWRAFNSKAGVDADNILRTAIGVQDIKKAEKRENTLSYVSSLIDRFLESRQTDNDKCSCDTKHVLSVMLCRCCGRRMGSYLVILYMFQKILFMTNIVLQFVALSFIFQDQFWLYGGKMLADPLPDDQWDSRGFVAFPRVTLCDFKIRRLGNLQRYTLQCVLPLNLYIEKMYIFIWFWMIFVMAVSLFYFIIWAIRFIKRDDRSNFVTNHLRAGHRLNSIGAQACTDNFVYAYLRQDGAFLLRLIATNTNRLVTTDIVCALWDHWCEKTGRNFDAPTPALTDDTAMDDEKPLIPKPVTHNGLKWRPRRKKKKDSEGDEKPKKPDVTRAPTFYVRGSDSLGRPSKRHPSYNNDSDTPTTSSDKPPSELYPMKDLQPSLPVETNIDDVSPEKNQLYPDVAGQSPVPSAPPSNTTPEPLEMTITPPGAPLAPIEDTAV